MPDEKIDETEHEIVKDTGSPVDAVNFRYPWYQAIYYWLSDKYNYAAFRVRETLSFWLLDLAFWIRGSHKSPHVMRALDEYKRVKSEPEREVMDLLKTHFMHGHSGGSHFATLSIFEHLANGKTLSPLTDDPNEWEDISRFSGYHHWQNKRNSACFSEDGGKTYTNLADGETHTDEDGSSYKTYDNLPVHSSVDHTTVN